MPELGKFVQLLGSSLSFDSNDSSTTILHAAQANITDALTSSAQPILNLISPGALTLAASGRAEIWLAGESSDTTAAAGVIADTIAAFDPNVAAHTQAETWHSLGSPGITNFTSDHGRYRLSANGDIEFDIVGHATGSVTAGLYAYANTLPSFYRPAVARSYAAGLPRGAGVPARIFVQTGGTVSLDIPALSSGNVVGCSAFMPLD